MTDFDWDDKASVVFPTVGAVAVHRNDDGDVVIRQENPWGDPDDAVLIPRHMLNAVIKAMREAGKA